MNPVEVQLTHRPLISTYASRCPDFAVASPSGRLIERPPPQLRVARPHLENVLVNVWFQTQRVVTGIENELPELVQPFPIAWTISLCDPGATFPVTHSTEYGPAPVCGDPTFTPSTLN